jgi:hypothetical protein
MNSTSAPFLVRALERFATATLALLAIMYSVGAIELLLGIAIGRHTLPLALGVTALALLWALPGKSHATMLALGGAVALCLGAYALGSFVVDVSWDGMAYHLPAAIYLSEGWNPFHSDAEVPWLNFYPLGQYTVSAAFAMLTGASVDGVKAFHFVYALAALSMVVLVLWEKRSFSPIRLVLGALLVASPTLLSQMCNSYVDSDLGTLLLCLGLALTLYRLTRARWWLLSGAACVVLLSGLKFTGLIYAAMLGGFLGAYYLYETWAQRKWREQVPLPATLGFALLFAVAVVGLHPYVTNLAQHGTPFYPSRDEIMKANIPDFYRGMAPPVAFLASVFSRTSDERSGTVRLKWPLEIDHDEIVVAGDYDTRSGGFGPFFAAQFLLTAALVLGFRRRVDRDWGLLGLALVLTIIPFPDPWWARYIPQFYNGLIALLLSIQGRSGPPETDRRRRSDLVLAIGSWAAIAAAAANLAVVSYSHLYYRCYAANVRAMQQLSELKARNAVVSMWRTSELPDNVGMSTTLEYRLRRAGVTLDESPEPECRHIKYVFDPAGYCERSGQ